ncbi:MAG: hypothetical protein JWL64_803 [Frankiales bacterium]|nr:hypothetical protein [Frankiales bacterium]
MRLRKLREADLADALTHAIDNQAPEQGVANAWTLRMSTRDLSRIRLELPAWQERLTATATHALGTRGLLTAGPVQLTVQEAPGRQRDRVTVLGQVRASGAEQATEPAGRPRLVGTHDGSVPQGSIAAAGVELAFYLPTGSAVVGSASDCDLRLPEGTSAERHLHLEVDEGRATLRVLPSASAVRLNGYPVRAADLHDSDRVDVGGVALVYKRDEVPDASGRAGSGGGPFATALASTSRALWVAVALLTVAAAVLGVAVVAASRSAATAAVLAGVAVLLGVVGLVMSLRHRVMQDVG